MRSTNYADELAFAEDTNGARIERLRMKADGQEEIRFSWWKDGRFQTRPLDLPESDLLPLMEEAIRKDVFSETFLADLERALRTRQGA